jgi:hypothetical protein
MKRSTSKIRAVAMAATQKLDPASWLLLLAAAALVALSYATSHGLR